MKNKEFHKLLKKNKSNSGFTLTELLVGLIMGTIVIGGLGFGLVQLLRSTRTGTAFTGARNESARALDFISDEVKRAVAIENTDANANSAANQFDPPNRTVVFALDIPEVNGNADPDGDSVLFGVDDDTTTTERIVYFLQSSANTNWNGPLVLHRWGPPLDANGNYTDGAWVEEALIDGIDNTHISNSPCDAGDLLSPPLLTGTAPTLTAPNISASATGFHTCLVGGSGSSTAELYLTSGVDVGGANLDTYTANTQVVARARVAPGDTSQNFTSYTMSYRTLDPRFSCNSGLDTEWSMRTDFGNSKANPSDIAMWDYQANRQPQPISITGDSLVVSSIPFGDSGDCLNSRVNNGRESPNPADPRDFSGNKDLDAQDAWDPNDSNDDDVVAISHEINFLDPRTFNGDPDTCTTSPCDGSVDGRVYSKNDGAAASLNSAVIMLKHGSEVPDYGGYDANDNGVLDSGDQKSLGEFLASQSPPLAAADGTHPSGNTKYVVTDKVLPNERIIAFEVGHESITNTNPGVDFQDNAFVVSSDAFSKKYANYEDNGSTGTFSPLP